MQKRIKRGWMQLRVAEIKDETHDTRTLYLVDAEEGGRQFDYTAGQYLTFRFDDLTAKPLVRSYTMSSSPNQADHIAITVKIVEHGLVSTYLCQKVETNQILRARGAMGGFVYKPEQDQKHLVMVAAGSGVTPFTSILREYAARLGAPDAPHNMTLLTSFRSKQDLINWDVLSSVSNLPGIRVITTLSREHAEEQGFQYGRIDSAMLSALLKKINHPEQCTYMTCGPQQMMDEVMETLLARGIPQKQIRCESFAN